MIICLCEGISDRDVRAAARQGISTVRELSDHCGAGTGCGSCIGDLRQLIDTHAPAEAEATHAHSGDRVASAELSLSRG